MTIALNESTDLPFVALAELLNAALSIAHAEKDPDRRVFALLDVAQAAKLAWQRLQPWPPIKG